MTRIKDDGGPSVSEASRAASGQMFIITSVSTKTVDNSLNED